MNEIVDRLEHRRYLNTYYGISRHFYDLTRKYYLFGRDTQNHELLTESWNSLVEVGPGTGRNLKKLYKGRPIARYGGVDASDEMLEHARRSCGFASLTQGFAEDAALDRVLGERPDRILLSYCLSMVQDPSAALKNARSCLAPGGEVVIVDFADCAGMPAPFAKGLQGWLKKFHVHPTDIGVLEALGAEVRFGPGRYYYRARLRVN